MKSADVSVVIPVHNRREKLEEALRSVSRQTLLPTEVIIVDDASRDPIDISALSGLSSGVPMRVIRNTVNIGGGRSRNLGASVARGKYIAFLDSDDAWRDTYLESVSSAFLLCGPDVGAIATSFYWCDEQLHPYRPQKPFSVEVNFDNLSRLGNFVGGCSVITVRAEVFGKSDKFSFYRGSEDWFLLLGLAKITKIVVLPDRLVWYRSPSASADNKSGMTYRFRRQILAVKKTLRYFGLAKSTSGVRIRHYTILMHLARSGRKRTFFRCLIYVLSRERRINRYYMLYAVEAMLGQRVNRLTRKISVRLKLAIFRRKYKSELEC